MTLFRFINNMLGKLFYLVKSDAPIWFIFRTFYLHILHRFCKNRAQFIEERDIFIARCKSLEVDNDWFSGNIPMWLKVFQENEYKQDSELECLEIGSWQGLSAVFTLEFFKNANLTCVDTWAGADEHRSEDASTLSVLNDVETVFNKNLAPHADRLNKYKGTSYQFFNDNFVAEKFDLIYIDGSHHSDDVVVDAVKSFEMLKVGGIIIFDDYLWQFYERAIDNPAGAINAFLRLKKYQLEIVSSQYQVCFRKISSSKRYEVEV